MRGHEDLVAISRAMTNHKYKIELYFDMLSYKYHISVLVRDSKKHLTDSMDDLPSIYELGNKITEMAKGANGKAKHGFYR